MGLCQSRKKTPEDFDNEKRSKDIDKENIDDHEREVEKIKLLLLGAGESGKSTVIKQMRVLYGAEYSDEEKISFRLFIHQNVIETMEALCDAATNLFPNDSIFATSQFQLIKKPEGGEFSQFRRMHIFNFYSRYFISITSVDLLTIITEFPELTRSYAESITFLWNSSVFQSVWGMDLFRHYSYYVTL